MTRGQRIGKRIILACWAGQAIAMVVLVGIVVAHFAWPVMP